MQNIKKIAHEYNIIKPKVDHLSDFLCQVKQLDEHAPALEIKICRESGGQWLLDEVCERLGHIQEKDYFGLRYTDKDKQRQWLDLGKNIYSQLKETHPIVVSFRIKHYPASPLLDLKQDMACYYLYLQLRRDLYSGRLLGKSSDLYQLAAYAVQSQLSDFDNTNDDTRYLSNIKLLPNLNAKTEGKITEIHKTLTGLTPDEAEIKFLEKACQLDTYGVEPFYVKDQKGNNLYVGLTHEGISTFQGSRRAHLFKWSDISKIHYQGKLFIVQVFLEEILNNQTMKKKHVLGFKCESTFAAGALWKWANDRMCFFSLSRSSEAKRVKSGGGIFKRRKTFRFSGRCQREIMQMGVSMMQINEQGSIVLGRSNTLVRGDVVPDDDYRGDKSKFNTMPLRDRGTLLGTQDTLDSLFIANHHSSSDIDDSQSPIGSPKSDHKSSFIGNISLEHITEEPHIIPHENFDTYGGVSNFLLDPRNSITQSSSARSSTHNLSFNSDYNLKKKLSSSNGDIADAIEQLQNAVSTSISHEITKAVKHEQSGYFLTKLLCLSCLTILGLFIVVLLSILVMVFALHYRDESGSYDFSGFFGDIVSNPSHLIRSQQLSRIASDGYSQVSNLLRSSASKTP